MLHCLELRTFDPVDDVPTVFLTDSATAFRHLILHGHIVGSQLLVLPWHQVTYILMKGKPSPIMSIDKCMAIIRQCPCLEYASLTLYPGPQASVSASCVTTHLWLSEFAIIGRPQLVWALLENLTSPALRNLAINYDRLMENSRIHSLLPRLISFISRSSCTIDSIYLSNYIPWHDAEEEAFADLSVSFVEQLPSLRRFKMQYKQESSSESSPGALVKHALTRQDGHMSRTRS